MRTLKDTGIPCKGFPKSQMHGPTYNMDALRATEIAHHALNNNLVSGSDRVAMEDVARGGGCRSSQLPLLFELDVVTP